MRGAISPLPQYVFMDNFTFTYLYFLSVESEKSLLEGRHICKLCVTNSIEQNPFEKLIVTQLVKKFPAFYGTRKIVTVFTRAPHFSLS
jgi:hypothetical protein